MAADPLRHRFSPFFSSGGFTLVEVMIALVIFTVALLGLAGLQASSIRDNRAARLNTVATQLAHQMGERIRANPLGAAGGGYEVDGTAGTVPQPSVDCYSGTCGPAEIAVNDTFEWLSAIATRLPEGAGCIRKVTTGGEVVHEITVVWSNGRAASSSPDCGPGGEGVSRMRLRVRS